MSWKDDRDVLIAQTMAFVQSVTGRTQNSRPEAGQPAPLPVVEALRAAPTANPEAPRAPTKVAEIPPAVAHPAPRPVGPSEVANEIRARIAGFRAHQERFNRERDEYFSKTLARLKATLNEIPSAQSDK